MLLRFALGALAVLLVLGGVAFALAGRGDDTATVAPKPGRAAAAVYVDAAGAGGRCDDGRTVEAARSTATPLCSVTRGIEIAPPDVPVVVRAGTYPALKLEGNGERRHPVTVAAAAGERVTIPTVDFSGGASDIRIEGMQIPDGVRLAGPVGESTAASHDIAIVGSTVGNRGRDPERPDAILLQWGSHDVEIANNRVTSAGNGIVLNSQSNRPGVPDATAEQLPPISDVKISGNKIGPVGVDAIRPANFERLTIEGNDITGVQENGDHSDALQVVWGGKDIVFRGNTVHDNAGQGFFIKDGQVDGAVVEDNVFTRNTSGPQIAIYETRGLRLSGNRVTGNEIDAQLGDDLRGARVVDNVLGGFTIDGDPARLRPNLTEDRNVIEGNSWNWVGAGYAGPNDKVKAPAEG